MAEDSLRQPSCEVCGTAEFLVIDIYRPARQTTFRRPAGVGREGAAGSP